MVQASIAILTFVDDLHALVIQDRLRSFPATTCEVVELDSLADHDRGVSWSTVPESFPVNVPTRDGHGLDLAACDLIWFRRWNHPQRAARDLGDAAYVDTVNGSTASALLGTLLTTFGGVWVNEPDASRRAENKLAQLHAAQADDLPGARSRTRHIRALCCASQIHAVTIESPDLDWRRNLDVPVAPVELDAVTTGRLGRMLELLGLKMGVVDLKLDPIGEPVWLELNPQGQFLFVEGLTGLDLTGAFSAFLRGEALAARAPA